MKILFIGDYSNLHACLAAELARLGHQVTVLSDGGAFMRTHADIRIERRPGFLGSVRYLFNLFSVLPDLKGYDVVQFINPNFLALRPGKIKYFFDNIRRQNGKTFLTLAGDDYFFVKACVDGKLFPFSEYKVGDRLTDLSLRDPERMYGWISDVNRRWNEYFYEKIDGGMAVLPEYDMAARPVLGDRLLYTGLPIDIQSLHFDPIDPAPAKLRILVGMKGGMEIQKGTARLLDICRKLEKEHPDRLEVTVAKNLPLTEYLDRLRGSHIVVDQLYAFSPATNALQTMAFGRIPVSGLQPEAVKYYKWPDSVKTCDSPSGIEANFMIPVSPLTDSERQLRKIIENPGAIPEMSHAARAFVEANNDVRDIAAKFLKKYES